MRNPVSHFSYAYSDINISRSTFDRNHDHKTTMSAGKLYPIFVDEYLPGDTFVLDTSVLARMSTPIHPVMDNAFLDVYFFSVPNRIVWEHWREFMGESPEDPYLNPVEYSIPQLIATNRTGAIPPKSILDYMGIPARTVPESFSALPVRAFCKIWNEWFRDQNLMNAIDIDEGDSDIEYSSIDVASGSKYFFNDNEHGQAYVQNSIRGGDLPPVAKYHDYFTSALKQQQKGDPVAIPLNGFVPVYAINGLNQRVFIDEGGYESIFPKADGFSVVSNTGEPLPKVILGTNEEGMMSAAGENPEGDGHIYFDNLGAYLGANKEISRQLGAAYSSINDLRYAFQVQKLLEADNRYGTRYTEIIKGHFRVDSPDGLLQRPEFLGGKRIRINMNQVLQTSATDSTSPQGNTAAYSLTADTSSSFTKSFTEHGWIIGVACIRTEHTYQQGLEKMWSRKDRYDFYFPELANISEQPIYNREIFNPTVIDSDDGETVEGYWETAREVFGFQEAWAEYRYKPNRTSGEFRSTYPGSLDIWHYGDLYSSQPYLSADWIAENRQNIDRTLAIQSDDSDQFICDFYFKYRCTRPMPVSSIPGLADHH